MVGETQRALDKLPTVAWMLVGTAGLLFLFSAAQRRPVLRVISGVILVSGSGLVVWLKTVQVADAAPPPAYAYFFHNGHLGEPLALTDYQGNVVWSTEYKPYGQLDGETGSVTIGNPSTTGIVWKPNFRFPGQYEDRETGLFYNHYRYYQPSLGTYTRPDPADTTHERNTYRYAVNNPLRFSDPLGLWPIEPTCDTVCKDGCRKKIEDGMQEACGYLEKPTCRDLLTRTFPSMSGLIPNTNRGESLFDCIKRRCRRDDPWKIGCSDKDYCGETPPGMMGVGCLIGQPEHYNRCPINNGRGYGPTLFHEMIHSCGDPLEPYKDTEALRPKQRAFNNIMKICSGWDERPWDRGD
jgi:RHS repeat-associated protein